MRNYFRTLFAGVNPFIYLQSVTPQQRTIVKYYLITVNIIFIAVILLFAYRLSVMKKEQNEYIDSRIKTQIFTKVESDSIKNQTPIDLQIYAWKFADINMKEKSLLADYKVAVNYDKKLFKHTPDFDVQNGILLKQKFINTIESNNILSDLYLVEAAVEPKLMIKLYPLDRELISIRIAPPPDVNSYYFTISEFEDYTEGAQNDYVLESMGFVNTIESYAYYPTGSDIESITYYANNRAYMVFNHKNIFSYLKSIQYVLLSISIAMLGLLINSKSNSPKNGRVAVIGGSIFALAANIFQINSTIKAVNAITLIDLITFFSGIVIVICFATTVRTLRFLDEEGYVTAKLFDLSIFFSIFIYSVIFFSFVYIYA